MGELLFFGHLRNTLYAVPLGSSQTCSNSLLRAGEEAEGEELGEGQKGRGSGRKP